MQSCIYEGRVRHRRFAPTPHSFDFRLFMMFVDLDELPALFDKRWFWSARRPALAWFRREDYLGDPALPLDEAVRRLVAERTGRRPTGPVRLLTHLRYFGRAFNPVSFYYCYDASGERVEHIVAEVTNTPWGESHCYVMNAKPDAGATDVQRHPFAKTFHVSPFIDMDVDYDWRFKPPGERLIVHNDSTSTEGKFFDVTLTLERREISGPNLARVLLKYPLMTMQVVAGIYWQALRLWLKKTPFFTHPNKRSRAAADERRTAEEQ